MSTDEDLLEGSEYDILSFLLMAILKSIRYIQKDWDFVTRPFVRIPRYKALSETVEPWLILYIRVFFHGCIRII